jgi:hypothetical protein
VGKLRAEDTRRCCATAFTRAGNLSIYSPRPAVSWLEF